MSEAKYLGLTANQLAKAASNLEAENAKLRDERDRMYKANVEKNGEILRLLEENAKLRELAVRMFHTIEWSDRMSDSMYWPSFSYERELRELGVEVD